MELLRQKESNKKKIADKIVKMEDSDQPDAYFCRFEDIIEAGIGQEEWPQHLHPLLTGKALAAYANNVPAEAKEKIHCFEGSITGSFRTNYRTMQTGYLDNDKEIWRLVARDGQKNRFYSEKDDTRMHNSTRGYHDFFKQIFVFVFCKMRELCSSPAAKVVARSSEPGP